MQGTEYLKRKRWKICVCGKAREVRRIFHRSCLPHSTVLQYSSNPTFIQQVDERGRASTSQIQLWNQQLRLHSVHHQLKSMYMKMKCTAIGLKMPTEFTLLKRIYSSVQVSDDSLISYDCRSVRLWLHNEVVLLVVVER